MTEAELQPHLSKIVDALNGIKNDLSRKIEEEVKKASDEILSKIKDILEGEKTA